jgi:hypothetical protein
MPDLIFNLGADFAHRLTATVRRERAALSVIERSQERIDDGYNDTIYVRFPTEPFGLIVRGTRTSSTHL